MQYCSTCGSKALEIKIPEGDHMPRHVCSNCGSIHYQNPKMVVGCLIENQHGEVMLCRRGIEPRKGYWNLPCGYMENNETIEQGALREVLEETGAEVDLGALYVVYSLPHANQVYLIFHAQMPARATYHLTFESTEIQFFALSKIPWNEIAFSSNTFALRHHLNQLNVGAAEKQLSVGSKSYEK